MTRKNSLHRFIQLQIFFFGIFPRLAGSVAIGAKSVSNSTDESQNHYAGEDTELKESAQAVDLFT